MIPGTSPTQTATDATSNLLPLSSFCNFMQKKFIPNESEQKSASSSHMAGQSFRQALLLVNLNTIEAYACVNYI